MQSGRKRGKGFFWENLGKCNFARGGKGVEAQGKRWLSFFSEKELHSGSHGRKFEAGGVAMRLSGRAGKDDLSGDRRARGWEPHRRVRNATLSTGMEKGGPSQRGVMIIASKNAIENLYP